MFCFGSVFHRRGVHGFWFVAARLEGFRSSFALAFDPNDVTGDEKRRETDDHQTPDDEHLPIQIIGFAWARVALAFLIKVHISKIILLSLPARSLRLPGVVFMDLPFVSYFSRPR